MSPEQIERLAQQSHETERKRQERFDLSVQALAKASTPREAIDIPLEGTWGSREKNQYGSMGPAKGLDFRACWTRLVGSGRLRPTHRVMEVSVEITRRRGSAHTRVRRTAVRDTGILLWDASDPRAYLKGNRLGPPPDRYWFSLPVETSASGDFSQLHVFLTEDGAAAYGEPHGRRGYFTDRYRQGGSGPFRATDQRIFYALPNGSPFVPSRSGRVKDGGSRDALKIPHWETRPIVKFSDVPEDQLQLMFWYSLQLGGRRLANL
jgi:hypothetical protein